VTSSLQRRLQLGLAASILVLLPLLIWGGGTAVRGLVREYALAGLGHDAEALLGAVRLAPAGRPEVPDAALAPVYRQPFSGHYFLVIDDSGVTQQSRSLWDHRVALDPVTAGERRVLELAGPQQQSLVVLAAGYRKDGRALTVAVAEDLAPIEHAIVRYQWTTALLALAALAGLVLVQRFIVGRAFRSLDGVRDDVRRVENGEADGLREDVPDEVRPLVREVNRLLALLDQRLQRSRHAMGNLAHALKTPLTLLLLQVDGEALRDRPESQREMRRHAERIRDLMERELRRARLAGTGAAGLHFHPRRDVPALLDALRRMHDRDDLRIEHGDLPAVTVPLDDEDMIELLGNLLDNACKWAKSSVRLDVAVDRALRVRVEDDGPGLDGEEAEAMLERGTRLDETRAGHGLGLAIVKDIVTLYGGRLALSPSAGLGGLRVEVTLPIGSDSG
jgi:signal transduction histidine kinase